MSPLNQSIIVHQIIDELLRAVSRHLRSKPLQVLLLLHGADDPQTDKRRVGMPPDALRALRITSAPFRGRAASGRAPQPTRVVVPRPPSGNVRVAPVVRQEHRSDRARREAPIVLSVVLVHA